jgi:hypothetical protein
MGNNKLTGELLERLLAEDGVTVAEDTSFADMLSKASKHFDFTITDDWNVNATYFFYTETTADGYEVWIATDNERNPNINDDVYYYESDWLEKMQDAMTDGNNIYFQELNDDNYNFEEVILNVYEEYYNDKKQELEEKLIDDGYEYETSEAIA